MLVSIKLFYIVNIKSFYILRNELQIEFVGVLLIEQCASSKPVYIEKWARVTRALSRSFVPIGNRT